MSLQFGTVPFVSLEYFLSGNDQTAGSPEEGTKMVCSSPRCFLKEKKNNPIYDCNKSLEIIVKAAKSSCFIPWSRILMCTHTWSMTWWYILVCNNCRIYNTIACSTWLMIISSILACYANQRHVAFYANSTVPTLHCKSQQLSLYLTTKNNWIERSLI